MKRARYDIRKIETSEDFGKWCGWVNDPKAVICNLQDIFSRSVEKALVEMFIGQPRNEKHVTVFCIQKAMGSDTLMTFIRGYARSKFTEYVESEGAEIDLRWSYLAREQRSFEHEKKTLEDDLEYAKAEVDRLGDLTADLRQTIQNLRESNDHLSEILEETRVENERLAIFEDHIKGLLVDGGRQVVSI